jgi:membrane associated rhomboid family serine protease
MHRSSQRYSASHVLRHRGYVCLVVLCLSLLFAHAAMMIWQNARPERLDLPPGYTSLDMLREGKFWTLLSHIWIHAGAFHLVLNLCLLFLFGRAVERRMGGIALVGVFVAAGVGGALAQLLLGATENSAIIGASGGIFGVIGACGVILGREPMIHFGRMWLSYRSLCLGLIAANFVLELADRAGIPGLANVAYITHLIGGILGAALAYWLGHGQSDLEPWDLEAHLPPSIPINEYVPMPTIRQAAQQEGEEWKFPLESAGSRSGLTLAERVDRILDRAAQVGVAGLTEKEKATLQEASKKLGAKNESSK